MEHNVEESKRSKPDMKNRAMAMFMASSLIVFPMFLGAQGSPAALGNKVAVIDIQQAILETGQGKQALQDLQKKYLPRRQEADQQQQEIQQLQQQLQNQKATLSADAQDRMNHELQQKETALKRLEEDAQSSFQYDRNTLMRHMGQRMVKVIDQYAKRHGYSLVIDGGQVPVYYMAGGVNITPEIVRSYDAAYPVRQATAPSGASSSISNPHSSEQRPAPSAVTAKPKP